MKQGSAPPAFPEALEDDADDVSWALQTAGVQWRRGARRDAIEWLERAVEAAVDGGHVDRARGIQLATNAIEAELNRESNRPPAFGAAVRYGSGQDGASEDDGAEPLGADAYHELSVDIDLEPDGDAEELDEDDLIEEETELDDDDVRSLSDDDDERPTLPPSSSDQRGAAAFALSTGPSEARRSHAEQSRASQAPRSPSEPSPTPAPNSTPFALTAPKRSSAPPASVRPSPSSSRPPAFVTPVSSRPPASVAPVSSRAASAAESSGKHQLPPPPEPVLARTGPSRAALPRPPSQRAVPRPSSLSLPPLGELSERLLPPSEPPAPKTLHSSRNAASLQPSSRPPSVRPEAAPAFSHSEPAPVRSSLPPSVDVAPPRVPFESDSGERPTERNLEPVPQPSVAARKFSEPPEEETTEREVPPLPSASDPAPSSHERTRVDSLEPAAASPPSAASQPDSPRTEPSPAIEASPLPPSLPPAAPSPPPSSAPLSPISEPPASIGGISLADVAGLEDLPEASQIALSHKAKVERLAEDEEISGFGLALVLEGEVSVMPTVADVVSARAKRGELIFSQGHLDAGVELRAVATAAGARVASWQHADFQQAILECPWVGEELRNVADRFQALAGVAMGPMGEQLDEGLRSLIVARCEIRRLLPEESIARAGKPVPGMVVLGAGKLELTAPNDTQIVGALGPGDFLFPSEILLAAPAPADARAGKGGALVLFAERKVAHELMVSVPPLLGIFA